VKRWLAILPSYLNGSKNEHNLVFPTPNGCRVPDGQNAMRTRKGRSPGMRMARERAITLLEGGPMNAKDVGIALWPGRSEGVVQRQARTKLSRLEQAGLVQSNRSVDGRVTYELTGAGRDALERARNVPTKAWDDLFERYMQAIGIQRKVRWHDLRHTAGSSLV